MIEARELRTILRNYKKSCIKARLRPTKTDFARFIGVSGQTVRNGVHKTYNGKSYGLKPRYNRVFANRCFDVLQEFFREE